ncbi:CrcB family protein [Nesterenkonia sp. MY13]|uniref:Fluoride-specific ion channel FluC n=1 Tax=Nesterenkonia sedimenti TaxID=1463632 RepID=A0A7X8TK68_9MICC|nr:CrcB family protein [Nesterenkonia sedimenti]
MVLAVALGGAAGAVCRYLLESLWRAGILIANTLGCLLLGLMIGIAAVATPWDAGVSALVSVGFIGALSTFSAVSLRAAQHWLAGERTVAAGLWLVHTGAGLGAGILGIAAALLLI